MQEVYSVNSHKFGRLKDKKKQTLWGGLKKHMQKMPQRRHMQLRHGHVVVFFGRGAFYKENR